MTLSAFEVGIGETGRIIITLCIFLFGLTTLSGWFLYYEILLRHLLKNRRPKLKNGLLTFFKWFYPIPGMLMVVYAASFGIPGQTVWYFADITSAIPTFINVVVILILSKKFFELLNDYKARHLGVGQVDPDFVLFYEDKEKQDAERKLM